MYFIDNHGFSCKPEVPQHHMLLPERSHQQLVDRADHKVREQRLFSALKPTVRDQTGCFAFIFRQPCTAAEQLPVLLIERRCAMRQTNPIGIVIHLSLIGGPGADARKQAVRCRLRRQSEK